MDIKASFDTYLSIISTKAKASSAHQEAAIKMLDVASTHSRGSTSLHSRPGTPPSGTGGKRIPASLMKMRRESLAATGKYNLKLPTVDASKLPDNSLISMTSKFKAQQSAASGGSSALPAFCTPKRHTPKTLQVALDLATSHLEKPDLGGLLEDDTAPVKRSSLNSTSSHSKKSTLRRCQTFDENTTKLTNKDMDSLLRSGLATPRRASRRHIRIPPAAAPTTVATETTTPQAKRFSKLKSNTTKDSLTGSNHSDGPRSTRRMARRAKSADETTNVLATPRRAARKASAAGVRRCHTMQPKSHSKKSLVVDQDEDHTASTSSFSDISDNTPVAAATEWTCACGEASPLDCGFCGMCGNPQRWECADCGYANKCKFKWCGMCGIPKKVVPKGQE